MTYLTVLFRKHKKHLPHSLDGTWVGECLKYGFMIFISAWILQGVRISNWREILIRCAIDAFLMTLMILLGVNCILAFVIAHSINFTLNGQLFAMFTHMGATHVSAGSFLRNTIILHDKISTHGFIRASIAYGSLSRGCYKRTSDIDIRLIPDTNGWWRTALYAVWLRSWAFLVHYPLDMYCYSPEVVTRMMRSDELPIMVSESDVCMMKWYPERVSFDVFVERFKELNIVNSDNEDC